MLRVYQFRHQGKVNVIPYYGSKFPDITSWLGTRSYLSGYCARFLGSSMVEHAAVNRRVVGSSPTRGAAPSCPANPKGLKTSCPYLG